MIFDEVAGVGTTGYDHQIPNTMKRQETSLGVIISCGGKPSAVKHGLATDRQMG
jgi:hypothetical protein